MSGNDFRQWAAAHQDDWLATYRPGGPPLWVVEMHIDLVEALGNIGAEVERLDLDDAVEQEQVDGFCRALDLVEAWIKRVYPTAGAR